MKPSIQTKQVFPAIGFAAIVLSLLCISCEPQYWEEYVIAKPEPIEDLEVTEVRAGRGVVGIACTFTRPAFAIEALIEGHIPDAFFFLRKEDGTTDEEIAVDNVLLHSYAADEVVTEDGMYVSENDIERGESYVLVGYTVDMEGQLSEPAISDPFVIPLFNVYE